MSSLRQLLAAPALCAVTFLAYSNSFSSGFPLDNKGLISQDPRVHEATTGNIGLILQHSYWWPRGNSGLYRPVTTLSYLFNYAILGDGESPAGYHWVNLLLHTGNVLLVYLLALRLIGSFWPSLLLGGLWAVHPVLTESVTNIVGRPDLLAGMAVLGGFWIYLKSAEAGGRPRLAWLAGLVAVTAVGVFSKESAVMLAAVIALYELVWWRGRRRALICGCIAVLAPVAALLYCRWLVFAGEPPVEFPFTDNPLSGAPFWQAKLTAVKVTARYLGLTIWPLKLSADYSYNAVPVASGRVEDWACWLAVAAVVTVVVMAYRRNRTAFFLAGFAFLTLLPASNLLFPIGSMMAERFLYLPSIGALACLVLASYAAVPRAAPIVLGALLCGFAVRTWVRNADWRDELSLAKSAAAACPRSFKTHQMMAAALYAADATHANVGAVLDEAEKSLAILDSVPDSRNTVEIYRLAGECYLIEGAYGKALPILQRGVAILEAGREQLNSKQPLRTTANDDLYRLLSAAWLRLGEGEKAFDAAIEARNREPLNPAVYTQLGQVLFAAHQPEDAATALLEGMLVTSDMGLRQQAMDLYRGGLDRQGCAIVAGPNGPAINPGCALVHRNLCEASVDAIKIHLKTGRPAIAAELKKSFLHDYGCPPGPLHEALPDAPGQ